MAMTELESMLTAVLACLVGYALIRAMFICYKYRRREQDIISICNLLAVRRIEETEFVDMLNRVRDRYNTPHMMYETWKQEITREEIEKVVKQYGL